MSRVTSLGHFGFYVQDMRKMIDFYTNVLGMTVTDRGTDDRIVFLSARPDEEHHELAFAKSADQVTDPQQVSFTVGSLADLKELYGKVRDYGCTFDRVVNHGIAFGCYFRDPENHRVEIYWSTGIDYPQPHADPIDIEASEADLMELIHNLPPRQRVAATA